MPEQAQEVRKYEKSKAKVDYQMKDGTPVPGVTTALGVMDKSGPLMYWAWDQGRQGKDYRKVRDEACDIGSLAHFMSECHLSGVKYDLSAFSKDDIDSAENCFLKFLDFWDRSKLKKIHTELRLVSERHGFGGTLDLVASDEKEGLWLVDWKTSKAIYDTYYAQVAAYGLLWFENMSTKINQFRIVRIGKQDVGDFEVVEFQPTKADIEVFMACLHLYRAKKAWNRK